MNISMRWAVLGAIALISACNSGGASNAARASDDGSAADAAPSAATPSPAPNAPNAEADGAAVSAERVLRTETVSGTFTGWEMGDYLWAQVAVPGHEPTSAMVEEPAHGLFLDANVGRPVTVEIQTVMMHIPEAGAEMEMRRIRAARNADGTAESWWQALSAADRAAAQQRFEEGALSSGGGN